MLHDASFYACARSSSIKVGGLLEFSLTLSGSVKGELKVYHTVCFLADFQPNRSPFLGIWITQSRVKLSSWFQKKGQEHW